jgi:predicted transcriptional regulator
MDAYSSHTGDISYSSSAPVLLAGSSGSALRRAEATIEACGLRIGAKLPIAEAIDRLKFQAAATAVWVELDQDCGPQMDEIIRRVNYDVSRRFYAAVVSVTSPLVDPVSAQINEDAIDVLIDANEAERTAALALAVSRYSEGAVSDLGRDRSSERLRQLSEEVSRIASSLARRSTGPTAPPLTVAGQRATAALAPLSADTVRNVIRARRLRGRFFSEELFADPAWDMLLDLLQAEIAQLRVPVSSLCIAASVPATTALRWLKTLVSQGLFVRRPDPHDGRRVYVELAPDASDALRRYFDELGPVAVI